MSENTEKRKLGKYLYGISQILEKGILPIIFYFPQTLISLKLDLLNDFYSLSNLRKGS